MNDSTSNPPEPFAVGQELKEKLKPYRKEWKRREKISEFVRQCVNAAKREDFFALDELLGSRAADRAREEPELAECAPLLDALAKEASAAIDRYRMQFIEDLRAEAEQNEVTLEIDFPRLAGRPGIEGAIDFASRRTTLNDKTLKSVDPRRIAAAVGRLEKRLYGRSLDPQAFIDELFAAYEAVLGKNGAEVGENAPIDEVYLQLVLARQSRTFFANLDKRKFRGYPVDEFAVDIYRFFLSDTPATSGGHRLRLRPGRSRALWLLDTDGQRRKITSLAFEPTR